MELCSFKIHSPGYQIVTFPYFFFFSTWNSRVLSFLSSTGWVSILQLRFFSPVKTPALQTSQCKWVNPEILNLTHTNTVISFKKHSCRTFIFKIPTVCQNAINLIFLSRFKMLKPFISLQVEECKEFGGFLGGAFVSFWCLIFEMD